MGNDELKNTITSIETQKRNKGRVNLYINGEYSFSCSLEVVYTNDLKKGKTVNKEMLSEIISEDNYLKCKSHALKALESSNKTEKEIYDKLLIKGYDDEIIERVIVFLKSYNFIDDVKYVDRYIKDKISSQGSQKIKYLLIKKGISKEMIKEGLQSIDDESEFNTALNLAEKRYIVLCKSETDSNKLYKKLGEYLMRRGYPYDVVKKVLGKVISNEY